MGTSTAGLLLLFIINLQSMRLMAFFSVTPSMRNIILCDKYELQKSLSLSSYDSRTTTEVDKDGEGAEPLTGSPEMKPSKFSEGVSICAENVGRMLFLDDILKGGRGDVRVGATGRWKDFKGNEIIRNADPEAK
eukprot:CCRYP_001415-RA/>CCRYP_001415-RA protein AED:0.28 eAED:0.28 QI:0/-1/0/1/-1/1/1/0/133